MGRPMSFVENSNPWSEFVLEDGSVLKVRIVLVAVEDSGQVHANGIPALVMQFEQIIHHTPAPAKIMPSQLKKGV